jgi:hypothetical protein
MLRSTAGWASVAAFNAACLQWVQWHLGWAARLTANRVPSWLHEKHHPIQAQRQDGNSNLLSLMQVPSVNLQLRPRANRLQQVGLKSQGWLAGGEVALSLHASRRIQGKGMQPAQGGYGCRAVASSGSSSSSGVGGVSSSRAPGQKHYHAPAATIPHF